MSMAKTNPSLKEFINKSINEINAALPDGYELSDEIEFEVTVLSTAGRDNKMDLKILQFGTDEKAEAAHKIKFTISNPAQQEKNALSIAKQTEKFVSSFLVGMMSTVKELEAGDEKKEKIATTNTNRTQRTRG